MLGSQTAAHLRYRARASPQPDVPSSDNVAPVFHRHKEQFGLFQLILREPVPGVVPVHLAGSEL